VLTGLLLAWSYGESTALTLDPSARLIGIGMYLALIMAFNVGDHLAEPEEGARIRGGRRDQGQGRGNRCHGLKAQCAAVDPMLLAMTNAH
jgi:hypothetical protein